MITLNKPVKGNADDGEGGDKAEQHWQHSGHRTKKPTNDAFAHNNDDDDDIFCDYYEEEKESDCKPEWCYEITL